MANETNNLLRDEMAASVTTSRAQIVNDADGVNDSAITQHLTYEVTDGDNEIPDSIITRASHISLINAGSPPTAAFNVVVPTRDRGQVVFRNETSFTASIKIAVQGGPPTVAPAEAALFNIRVAGTVKLTGAGATSLAFIQLTDVPTDYTGDALKLVRVNAGETALEFVPVASLAVIESFIIAASDESTALTTGTNKVKWRMPYAFTVTAVKASLSTAQTSGSIFTVDINESGSTILSTKLTIDNTETTSVTAATAAVISDTSLAADAEMSIDIDQIGDGTAKGLKVVIIGHQ